MRSSLAIWLATVLIGAALAAPASGQTAVPRLAPASPLPGIVPPVAPEVQPGAVIPPESENPAAMPDMQVPVTTVAIEGMTVYAIGSFADATAGLIGPAVPLAAIDAARFAILRRYRDDGYALTAVSAIVEAGGRLRLRVTEGRIAEVKLDGDIGPAGAQVLRFLQRLTVPAVIDTATLERALLLAGDIPGVSLRAVLRPSADEPGALTLVAQVTRQAVGGQVTADNRAFANVGPEQGLAVVDVNSLSEFGEHTQVQLYRTLSGAQIFGNAQVDSFIGSSGLRISLYGGTGLSTPTGPFRSIDYIGRTTLAGVQLSYPLIRARRDTLSLLAGFDVIEASVRQNNQLSSNDELRVLRFGSDYAFADQWLGDTRSAINGVTVRLSQGLSGLGATPADAALAGRTGQQPAFRKISLDLVRTQTLLQPWEGATLALQAVAAGQYSPDVLPSAEKFFLGGSRLMRGFYYGEVTGDNALTATAELQLNTVTDIAWFGPPVEISNQFYGFYDWGETWENQVTDLGHRLRSAGIGVRVIPHPRLELDLEAVTRITRFPTGNGPGVAPLPAQAFYWRLLARF